MHKIIKVGLCCVTPKDKNALKTKTRHYKSKYKNQILSGIEWVGLRKGRLVEDKPYRWVDLYLGGL